MADLDHRDRPPSVAASSYDEDYAGWAGHQAQLLRTRQVDGLDFEHLAEELEGMSRSELRALTSSLRILILHMLKWDHQPSLRSRSWAGSILNHRLEIAELLEDNPSLRAKIGAAVERAYPGAVAQALVETGLPAHVVPRTCPYTWEAMMGRVHVFEIE
jgi:Domain of unknown function DUF29